MKSFFVVLLATFFSLHATAQGISDLPFPANEVKFNIMNTIVLGSVELGYEHFIDNTQSIGAEVHLFDRFAYVSDKGTGRAFDATSYVLGFNYYFLTPDRPSGFYINPFIKYRSGTFSETDTANDVVETDLHAVIIGMGGGYKWVHNKKFALGPFFNVGRGFNGEAAERFTPVEFKAGFSIGFRF